MRVNDAVLGAALVAFAAALALYARTFPAIPGQDYGAAVFPTLIALGLAGCGLVMIVDGARRWEGAIAWAEWTRSPGPWINLAAALAAVFAVIFASQWLGFIPITTVALIALFLLLGVRWWISVPAAFLVALLIHQLFTVLLLVPLPRGVFLP